MSSVETTVTVKSNVTYKRMADLLCNAFEGGSNYWIANVDITRGRLDGNPWSEERRHPLYCAPFSTEGYLLIAADDHKNPDRPDGLWLLDLAALKRGAQVMAEKEPRHFADLQNENDDATTGDVFLQCCLFGEVVFG